MPKPSGMPDELWDAIIADYPLSMGLLLEDWEEIGAGNQELLAHYVTKGWTRRARRSRAKLAAEQLTSPGTDPGAGPPPIMSPY